MDISQTFDVKMTASPCYASQFEGSKAAGEIHPTGLDLYELIRVQSAHYGSLIRRPYGETFFCYETLEVQDVLQLGVQSLESVDSPHMSKRLVYLDNAATTPVREELL